MSLSFKVPRRIAAVSRSRVVSPRHGETGNDAPIRPDSGHEPEGDERRAPAEERLPDTDPAPTLPLQQQAAAEAIQRKHASLAHDAPSEDPAAETTPDHSALLDALSTLQEAAAQLHDRQEDILFDHEADMVRLALEIARLVVGREIQFSNDIILHSVRELVGRVSQAKSLRVLCHPDDLAYLQQNAAFAAWQSEQNVHLTFESDGSISKGGCRVDTSFGVLDGTIESKFYEIKTQLLGEA